MLYYVSYVDNITGKFHHMTYETPLQSLGLKQLSEITEKGKSMCQSPSIISWQPLPPVATRHQYPEHVLKILREHYNLNSTDTSHDEDFNTLSPDEVFNRVLEWNGIQGYQTSIKGFIRDIYSVTL